VLDQNEKTCRFRYGGLEVNLLCLDQRGGFTFKPEEIGEPPRAAWTPLLSRPAPWAKGDFVNVVTVVRPANAEGVVRVKALTHGAAAVLVEPGARKAFVWAANLHRQWQQYLLRLPAGAKVRTYKRDVEMPLVPPGEPANTGLLGGESAVWVLDSEAPLDPNVLDDGLASGKGR